MYFYTLIQYSRLSHFQVSKTKCWIDIRRLEFIEMNQLVKFTGTQIWTVVGTKRNVVQGSERNPWIYWWILYFSGLHIIQEQICPSQPFRTKQNISRDLVLGQPTCTGSFCVDWDEYWTQIQPLCSAQMLVRIPFILLHLMPSLYSLNMNAILKLNLSVEKTGNVTPWSLQPSCVGVPNKNQPNKLSEHKLSSVLLKENLKFSHRESLCNLRVVNTSHKASTPSHYVGVNQNNM